MYDFMSALKISSEVPLLPKPTHVRSCARYGSSTRMSWMPKYTTFPIYEFMSAFKISSEIPLLPKPTHVRSCARHGSSKLIVCDQGGNVKICYMDMTCKGKQKIFNENQQYVLESPHPKKLNVWMGVQNFHCIQ